MQIERGASNTFALLGRPILSPSYWLLWFRDPERNASVYCIATASNTTGGMLTLTFTETDTPTALDGEVKLSPRGNWELRVYEQTSATNLDPASAGRLVKTIGILVVGDAATDTGWSVTACPPGGGGGDCPPTTVNGTESDTPTILVQQGGVNVGTLNPATGVHTVPECDPCEDGGVTFATIPLLSIPSGGTEDIDCDTVLDAVVVSGASETQKNGTYTPSATVNGRTSYDLAPNHVIEWNGSQYINRDIFVGTDWITNNAPTTPWAGVWVEFVGGAAIDGTVAQATIGTFCATPATPCDPLDYEVYNTEATLLIDGSQVDPCGALVQLTVQDASVRLRDTAANLLSTTAVPATKTVDITAPDGSVQLKNTGGTNIGSPVAVRSNQTGVVVTAPDGTFRTTDGLTTIAAVKSNGTADAPQTRVPYKDAANADQLTAVANTEFASGTLRPAGFIPRITIYESDGVTVQGYTDIGSPTYVVAQFLKMVWAAGDANTFIDPDTGLGWVVTAQEAGTFTVFTPTGTNGTVTYSKNEGAFTALSGTITLAIGDRIIQNRTITTNSGSMLWEA